VELLGSPHILWGGTEFFQVGLPLGSCRHDFLRLLSFCWRTGTHKIWEAAC
jgi:hypothetical protein